MYPLNLIEHLSLGITVIIPLESGLSWVNNISPPWIKIKEQEFNSLP
jgi:hypothetical protein